ncbi:MAG: hypothetical protein HOI20_14040 [Gemmatimonadetes bacterium]|jgi:hypothetical protein|nr:hypothetical protein [Gemmatimonadota bacterium]MDE0963540.1 hypothetical protein [Candidatus Latescibacterota bacterium]MBT5802716.1 hypothetical protein [Gemmatimonadota bacterium]MBT6619449.1 hypothetical protein [Gemmatimonadota bacterium]MBT6903102.1 hypothetical protein [Gemmatimonadota bacterium]
MQNGTTLTRCIFEEERRHPEATGIKDDVETLIECAAGKRTQKRVEGVGVSPA